MCWWRPRTVHRPLCGAAFCMRHMGLCLEHGQPCSGTSASETSHTSGCLTQQRVSQRAQVLQNQLRLLSKTAFIENRQKKKHNREVETPKKCTQRTPGCSSSAACSLLPPARHTRDIRSQVYTCIYFKIENKRLFLLQKHSLALLISISAQSRQELWAGTAT